MFNSVSTFRLKSSAMTTIIMGMIFLSIVSALALYSSLHQAGEFKEQDIFYKQITWLIISGISFVIFSFLNYRLLFDIAFIFYAFNLVLLVAVDLFGKTALGAQRWLNIGGFNFQPSELSKGAIIFVLARLFSSTEKKGFFRGIIFPFILVALNALFIVKQPDLGTALILIFLFFMIGFASQVKKRYFIFLILFAATLCPFAWNHLKSYQQKRLIVFLNPNAEPLGAGYTIIQSKIAIGSGRIIGKGFLSGTQNQFNFLPERHTDFIFTVIAEEWGLIGSLFLLFVYFLIIKNMLEIIRYLKDPFAVLLSLGISSFFFLQVFINIGMTLGILPVVGLPLMFISYGGTHLLVSFSLLGIFYNIWRQANN
ncbi:MAG: rod shape-determining protein RodA [Candidatus Omnitrophota bacterium]|nr:rod shape-determining protein RodA [Candidatus Omnitrophota bacterium]